MISIIIPTLNEERNLPLLLESLRNQTYRDFEVIIADANSKDKTREIAKEWGCKIIDGGLPGVGRNRGAEAAKGEILIFLDSDVVLPPDFLENVFKEFKGRKLDIAGCYVQPLTDKDIDNLLYGFANLYFRLTQFFLPQAAGHCIVVKKKIHQKINGFDEKIKLTEDFDYSKRAAEIGKFRFLEKVKIPVSMRRLDQEGRMTMATKYILIGIYFALFGGIKSDIFKYRFSHYGKKKETLKEKIESLNFNINITSRIKSIKAREILDSRGEPTIEVELSANGSKFKASVPSGASKGKFEAKELRDGGKRHQGKGVLRAVAGINEIIAPKIIGKYVINQIKIDGIINKLDGTKDKSRLGANSALAVSMAVCRAGAEAKSVPLYQHLADIYSEKILIFSKKKFSLPTPCFNVINGGAHAGNQLDVQEFMVVPQMDSFAKNLEEGVKIYQCLKGLLKDKFGKSAVNLGDEGGFAPSLKRTQDCLSLIMTAAKKVGSTKKIKIGLDVAASQFYLPPHHNIGSRGRNKKYHFEGKKFNSDQLLNFYKNLIKKFPIIFLEDPFDEEDCAGFQKAQKTIGKKVFRSRGASKVLVRDEVLILGDDFLTTNIERITRAYREEACSGTIIKPNQIGTVIETIEAAKLAKSYDWKILVSHRSGDTADSFIADLAVGVNADFIKSGAPARGERVAKYNRLLEIEEEIKKKFRSL